MLFLRTLDTEKIDKDGEPSGSSFMPGERDAGGLSADVQGDTHTPEAAFNQ
ncbi:hypothetical protein HDU90_002040 [Geranomyces variabilis]|nr:hypothetical protein HDU90_002040 [Geranomyces variabilis]